MINKSNLKFIIVSDVNQRDGIGIEIWEKDKLIIEIFRDDSKKSREVTTYKKDISLDLVEYAIDCFKKEIPNKFLD